MKMEKLLEVVKNLEIGSSKDIYESIDGTMIYIKRPEKVGRNVKRKYDVKTNIQIWAREPGKKEFMPNHLRILIDLELKKQVRPELKKTLLLLFDKIYYGDDPKILFESVKDISFPKPLKPLDYDMYLAQLFIAEQGTGYIHESKFDPKYLFFQGWVRCVLSGDLEIDKVCWSATQNAPSPRYTREDNKKHKKYNPNRRELWYIEEDIST
ncbi:MAG: hypothetical protein PHU34_09825 [Candidatus Methanoperedens sp.]|nr:hypothetical protein [Candidatus Methanoperedens sp.]